MKKPDINWNTKSNEALEIIAAKINLTLSRGYTKESKEYLDLLDERNEIFKGNKIIMERVIQVYGLEIENFIIESLNIHN